MNEFIFSVVSRFSANVLACLLAVLASLEEVAVVVVVVVVILWPLVANSVGFNNFYIKIWASCLE